MLNPNDPKYYEILKMEADKLIDEFMINRLPQFSESIEQLFSNNRIAKCDTYFDKLFYFVVYLDDFVFQSEHCKQFLRMNKLLARSEGDEKTLIRTTESVKDAIINGIMSSSDSKAKNSLNNVIDKLDNTTIKCYLFIDSINGIPAISFLIPSYIAEDAADADALKAMYFKGITGYGLSTIYISRR